MGRSGSRRGGIGLFGGTFDPIHFGHLRGAEEAREVLGLKTVWFIPAAVPPHKPRRPCLPAPHRLRMVRLAVAGHPGFKVSDVECRRHAPSYSIETVEHFSRVTRGRAPLTFILGADAFREITTWMDYERLFSLCNMLVLTRPGCAVTGIKEALPIEVRRKFCYDTTDGGYAHTSGHTIRFARMTSLDISSTEIRRLVRDGKTISYLLPPAVEKYVLSHRFYRER